MTRFDWCVERLLEREGGLVNHPDDPGGVTKYGISQRAYPDMDIKGLTRDGAIALYHHDYWEASTAWKLPEPLDFYLFDAAVNQGVATSAKLLQQAIGVTPDGVIGPITLRRIERLGADEAGALFMAQRALHYVSLATFDTFGKGWLKRLFRVAGEA